MKKKELGIEETSWIKIELTMLCSPEGLESGEKIMKLFGRELKWAVTVHRIGRLDENGNRYHRIRCFPSGDGMISPAEYSEIRDRLKQFAHDMEVGEKVKVPLMHRHVLDHIAEATYQDDIYLRLAYGEDSLSLVYKLGDRIKLEKKNAKMAEEIFEESLEKTYKGLSFDTDFFRKAKNG